MNIAIGADHGGFAIKEKIKQKFKEHNFIDVGAVDLDPADSYVGYSLAVGGAIQESRADVGIMICRTGVGAVIALNKMVGIRAGVLENVDSVILARKKNNVNVLSFGADNVSEKKAIKLIDAFLTTEFEGGRHANRLEEIREYEERHIRK